MTEPTPEKLRRLSTEFVHRRFSSVDLDGTESETESLLGLPPSALPPAHSWRETLTTRLHDVVLISELAFRLYAYLFTSFKWLFQFLRLLLFAAFLMPGFSQMIMFYFFSPRVIRSVPYGIESRNALDIYLPRKKWRRQGPCPVVVYVTGGAWTIGYKAWGALFARRLSQRGVLVFCIDYRNFPQGTITDMVRDVNTGITWVLNNCHLYGGDPNAIYLVGQSAGVHLTLLALIAQNRRQIQGGFPEGSVPSWNPSRFAAYIGVSGAFNLLTLQDHLDARGLPKAMFSKIMSDSLVEFSPTLIIKDLDETVVKSLPPMTLFHGTADQSVPVENAVQFCKTMKEAGGNCKLHLYHGKNHTEPIVQDPMRQGRDTLMDDVLSVVRGHSCYNTQLGMVPAIMIDFASFVCPF